MSELKDEETKERTKERREEENQQQQQRLRHARTSVLFDGRLTAGEVYVAADRIKGMTIDDACDWIDYMNEVGWVFPNGDEVSEKNFGRSLRMWFKTKDRVKVQQEQTARRLARMNGKRRDGSPDYEAIEAKRRAIQAKRREEASKADGAWDLCAERCANCLGGKHCPYFATPPQLREWPLAPEQCSKFKPLEAKGASL